MAPVSAVVGSGNDAARQIYDAIEAQFSLDHEKLHDIVKQFLEDFRVGLSEYNHPMAMMYVGRRSSRGSGTDPLQTYLRHWRTGRIRNRVSSRYAPRPARNPVGHYDLRVSSVFIYSLIEHSWPWISVVQICTFLHLLRARERFNGYS